MTTNIKKELAYLFPATHSLENEFLLVIPTTFHKLIDRTLQMRAFIFACQGHMEFVFNDQSFQIQAPFYLELFSHSKLRITRISRDIKAYGMFMEDAFFLQTLQNLHPIPDSYVINLQQIPILRLMPEDVDLLEQCLMRLKQILLQPTHTFRRELIQLYFKEYTLELGNIFFKQYKNIDNTSEREKLITLHFLELVKKHHKTEHQVVFYANALNISPKHLTRTVKKTFKQTSHAVIDSWLIQTAILLLKDQNLSIQQIAEELHFADQAAFSKFFKKHQQLSPNAYRKQLC